MTAPPKIDNAPGIVFSPRKWGFEIRWRARTDLVRDGYLPKSLKLWIASEHEREPSDIQKQWIADRCRSMQNDMLVWDKGGTPQVGIFDGTLGGLIRCYQTDKDSPYRKLRPVTRNYYNGLCRRLEAARGDVLIDDIKARDVLRWHAEWMGDEGKVSIAHTFVTMLRILVNFGLTIMESEDCDRLSRVLSKMKFQNSKPRQVTLSAAQVTAVRAEAHKAGHHSLALAQAFQFDGTLRQKDVIGEWVSIGETGLSEIVRGNDKWLRGIRWEEIDANLVLRHVTSKRNKMIEIPLREAPMVMDELRQYAGLGPGAALTRDLFPASGPVVVNESTGFPWSNIHFRHKWRKLATAAGIPVNVRNMDSRAGAITEGLVATDGDLDAVRIAATHSNVSTTQGYSRGHAERTAEVMRRRAALRNKNGTDGV